MGGNVVFRLQRLFSSCTLEDEEFDLATRSRRSAQYQVGGVSARQDGEARIVSWNHATGPQPVTRYNIYRTFTTAVPFDVTQLDPIATVSSSQPRQWRDTCRTEEASVRYAVTAVDVLGAEHTSSVVSSQLLPLVGSFVSSTPLKYPIVSIQQCCVVCHDMVFNPDRSEFLLAYDCDNDGDGNGDDVFVSRLDYSGDTIEAARSIKASVQGTVFHFSDKNQYYGLQTSFTIAYTH